MCVISVKYFLLKIKNNTRPIYQCDQRFRNVDKHPYLGIEFSYDLKWKTNIGNVAAKATRVLGMLHRVLRGADMKTKEMVYFTLVGPILE